MQLTTQHPGVLRGKRTPMGLQVSDFRCKGAVDGAHDNDEALISSASLPFMIAQLCHLDTMLLVKKKIENSSFLSVCLFNLYFSVIQPGGISGHGNHGGMCNMWLYWIKTSCCKNPSHVHFNMPYPWHLSSVNNCELYSTAGSDQALELMSTARTNLIYRISVDWCKCGCVTEGDREMRANEPHMI